MYKCKICEQILNVSNIMDLVTHTIQKHDIILRPVQTLNFFEHISNEYIVNE